MTCRFPLLASRHYIVQRPTKQCLSDLSDSSFSQSPRSPARDEAGEAGTGGSPCVLHSSAPNLVASHAQFAMRPHDTGNRIRNPLKKGSKKAQKSSAGGHLLRSPSAPRSFSDNHSLHWTQAAANGALGKPGWPGQLCPRPFRGTRSAAALFDFKSGESRTPPHPTRRPSHQSRGEG